MSTNATLREATADDADAILNLVTLCDLAEVGKVTTSIGEVRSDVSSRTLHAAVLDAQDPRYSDPNDGLVGYVWLEHAPTHTKLWGDIAVRPGSSPELGQVLLDWMLAKAAELAPDRPLHVFADSQNSLKRRLYSAAGGEIVRRFYRMVIDLDGVPPAVPPLAQGVEVRVLSDTAVADRAADLRAMHEVVDVAFMDHFGHEPEPFETWKEHTPDGAYPDLSLYWLASVDGVPAAGLYGGVLPTHGYVDTLGTLRAFRGRGLGRALLLTAFAEFHRRGLRSVALGVDATNPTGALELYESVGMSARLEGHRYEIPPAQPA